MLTISQRFGQVLEKLINAAIEERRDSLTMNWTTSTGIEQIRLMQGEVAGLRLCLEMMQEADEIVRNER